MCHCLIACAYPQISIIIAYDTGLNLRLVSPMCRSSFRLNPNLVSEKTDSQESEFERTASMFPHAPFLPKSVLDGSSRSQRHGARDERGVFRGESMERERSHADSHKLRRRWWCRIVGSEGCLIRFTVGVRDSKADEE